MTKQYLIFCLLVVSIIFIDEGINKVYEKRIFYQKRISTILLILIFTLPVFLEFAVIWSSDQQYKHIYLFIVICIGALLIHRLSIEFTSRSITVYGIEEVELIEIISLILHNSGLNFEHKKFSFENIFIIQYSKSKIKVTEVPVFGNNKQVLINKVYDFSILNEFLIGLKEELIIRKHKQWKFRGVFEILLAVGSLVFAIVLVLL